MGKIIVTRAVKALLDQGGNFLNREDIKIFPAVSNGEVLEIQKAERADVIIADLDDPVLSGELLCQAIRENSELCRVSMIVMHSGSTSDIQRIPGCRANAFVERSADPASVIEKVRRLMHIPVRESFRVPIGTEVECGNNRIMSIGYSENISATGMLFDSETKFLKGEIFSCWFLLPDSTHIRTDAEIVRVCVRATEHDPHRYGIRFTNLAPEFRAAIEKYIKNKKSKP